MGGSFAGLVEVALRSLLDWTRGQTFPAAVGLALAVNVAVFFLALLLGHLIVWIFHARLVSEPPEAISAREVALASCCVVLNTVVMLAGWWLFREGLLGVEAGAGWLRWIGDAVVLVVVMDLAMYLTHRLAHVEPFYRLVHGVHHRHERVRPLTLFVLHPLEVLGFGGLWIVVLCTRTFSLGGMLLYLSWNTIFGMVGHVGVEPCPDAWARWPVLSSIGTSTFHARHHQHPRSNFGFYTTLWDRIFGTLDPDYLPSFARLPSSTRSSS